MTSWPKWGALCGLLALAVYRGCRDGIHDLAKDLFIPD